MKDRSSAMIARHRGTIRNAGWGLLALMVLWLAPGAIAAAPADRKAEAEPAKAAPKATTKKAGAKAKPKKVGRRGGSD